MLACVVVVGSLAMVMGCRLVRGCSRMTVI